MSGRLAPVSIALAQINSTVGGLEANAAKIREYTARARDAGAEIVVFPELAITGYPPEDLLLREAFLAAAEEALVEAASEAEGIVALIGATERADDVFNTLAVCVDGKVMGRHRKAVLPNYGVFDERRYFQSGDGGTLLELGDLRTTLTVCEDVWVAEGPAADAALAGASLMINGSASPYHAGKGAERERMLAQRARDHLFSVAYCNLVGGQDELLFDGHSLLLDHEGKVLARGPQFEEALVLGNVDPQEAITARLRDTRGRPAVHRSLPDVRRIGRLERRRPAAPKRLGGEIAPLLGADEEIYAALVLGVRDYVTKNGFEHVVLGLSGGIDSTLVLLVAVDALGPEHVTAVVMPSRYSSSGTQSDARALATNLGVRSMEIPIEPAIGVYEEMLAEAFAGREPDLTEENLQARVRGNLLMALSNKFGWLVLTTGNKSEVSVGYSTLYGDSAGGFAVIKDVPKTVVYRLTAMRDAELGAERGGLGPVPQEVITRPPTAELRHEQQDSDSLPPYDILDPILAGYVERDADRQELELSGLPRADIDRVLRLVDLAEYKRRQAPPGIKITERAFGRDRRMPITNRYRP